MRRMIVLSWISIVGRPWYYEIDLGPYGYVIDKSKYMYFEKNSHFGKQAFWEKRNSSQFDWYQSWDNLKDIITQFIRPESRILNVGAGNSPMSMAMYQDGYKQITDIDFSEIVVEDMEHRYKEANLDDTLKYLLCDVRNMRDLEAESFDCVIDKGTLDSVLCGAYSRQNTRKMLNEISRVLKNRGYYVCVTYGDQEIRKEYLDDRNYRWTLLSECPYKIFKPNIDESGRSPAFDDKDKDKNKDYYHYVYILQKGIDSFAEPKTSSMMVNSQRMMGWDIIQLPMSERKYTLLVQWFDDKASIIKQFYLSYFLPQNHIEMYDIKNSKVFLKKIHYPQIQLDQLFLGNIVICYGRQLKIVDFADDFTRRNLLGSESYKTYAMIKPNAYLNMGKIIAMVQKEFTVANLKMFRFDRNTLEKFYAQHQGKSFFPRLTTFMLSDYVVGMELLAKNAVSAWRTLLGPTDYSKAKAEAPSSVRALFGKDSTQNAAHGSDAPESAERELGIIFGDSQLRSKPQLTNATLCIIKPHIVKVKEVGKIIDFILTAGFQISALQMIWFDVAVAQQFYEAYKFLPECRRLIEQLSSGPSVCLEIRQENAVDAFRKFCGPHDPQIARKLEPHTLRAKFGKDRVENGIHCTDIADDSRLELQYVFQTLLQ